MVPKSFDKLREDLDKNLATEKGGKSPALLMLKDLFNEYDKLVLTLQVIDQAGLLSTITSLHAMRLAVMQLEESPAIASMGS